MMKKLFLLTLLVAGVMMGVEAQNRSIDFEQTKEWKKVLKKAKKEKKLIFVDCYTSWCGPCKMLAKDVFTRDEVCLLYTSHSILFCWVPRCMIELWLLPNSGMEILRSNGNANKRPIWVWNCLCLKDVSIWKDVISTRKLPICWII